MVINITIVVAALSVGTLVRMRDQAFKATSIRNISQLQIASASYAANNTGNDVPIYACDDEGVHIGFWYQNPDFLSNLAGDVRDASGNPARSAWSQCESVTQPQPGFQSTGINGFRNYHRLSGHL